MLKPSVTLSLQSRRCKNGALALIVALLALAVPPPKNTFAANAQDRAIIQGLQAIEQNQWNVGQGLISGTKDPLGAKIYYWLTYQKQPAQKVGYQRLTQFVRQNPDWPGTRNLRFSIEDVMPTKISASEASTWFNDYPPLTVRGFFIYAESLVGTGQTTKAKAIVNEWWAEKRLSRDEQKKLYTLYGAYITPDAHRKRLDNLVETGQYANAKAVANVLGNGYPELTAARIALRQKKPGVNALIEKVPGRLKSDPGLLYERLKWRRKNDLNDGAIQILNAAPPMNKVNNPKDWWLERHIIVRRYLEQKNYLKAYKLSADHKQTDGLPHAQAEWLAGWVSLRFLSKPDQALKHFTDMYNNVKSPISKARGAYWAGRAANDSGNKELAQKWYTEAAQYQTTFYGQTAGAQIGKAKALTFAAPPKLSAAQVAAFNQNELIRAAKLFHAAGLHDETGDFLQAFVAGNQSPESYMFAAELASDMKQYNDSVKIAKEATKKGLFFTAQAFPIIPDQLERINMDWALVHALIRQESQFDIRARSPAGALGLMQLMPATARETARSLKLRHQTSDLTNKPSHNIALGSEYLRKMLVRYGGSYPMAIAAYNAGPGRVDQWIKIYGDPRLGHIDLIDWIEMIPIYETRNYVQRVLEGTYVYNLRLKDIRSDTKEPVHVARVY